MLSMAIGSMLISGCSQEPIAMPSPKINLYLLDLTGSGNVMSQLKRIEDDLRLSMTREAIGNPFYELGQTSGPSLTRVYFVGTNSFDMTDFTLQNLEVPFALNNYINNKNNQKRRVKFWGLLTTQYNSYVKSFFEKAQAPSKESCLNHFDRQLESTWSGQQVRDIYSSFLCDMAVYSLENYEAMREYIRVESAPKVQKASDVFGALSKIKDISSKYRNKYPDAQVKVILATDGDHRVGNNDPSNLRIRLDGATNLCDLAEKIKSEYKLEELTQSAWLQIDARGIAALTKGKGEYPRKLNDFWLGCFFQKV